MGYADHPVFYVVREADINPVISNAQAVPVISTFKSIFCIITRASRFVKRLFDKVELFDLRKL